MGKLHTRITATLYARVPRFVVPSVKRWKPALSVLLLVACACACARDEGEQPASAPATTRNASVLKNLDTAFWTAGLTAKPGAGIATLTQVRTASHDEFERIVFTFEPELPGYHIEYVDRPVRQCGSGDVVPFPGDAWLSVRLEPAQAHTEEGKPTVAERTRDLNYQQVKQIKLICDFEAVVEWIVAVGSPARYRTLELRDPPRLVIDLRK